MKCTFYHVAWAAYKQGVELVLRGDAGAPDVAPVAAPRAEGEEARRALRVVAGGHAGGVAPGAVNHVGHRVQRPPQRQRLPPRVALLGEEAPQHRRRQRRAARRVRARQRGHAAFLHVDAAVGLHALDAERMVARELDEVYACKNVEEEGEILNNFHHQNVLKK